MRHGPLDAPWENEEKGFVESDEDQRVARGNPPVERGASMITH